MRKTGALFVLFFLTLSKCDVQLQNTLGGTYLDLSEQVRLVCTNTNDTVTELFYGSTSLGSCYGSSMFCSVTESRFTITFDVSALPFKYYVNFTNGFDPSLCGDFTCTDTELGFSDSVELSYRNFDNDTYDFDDDEDGVRITLVCAFPDINISIKWFIVLDDKTKELKTEETSGHVTQFRLTSTCQSVSCDGKNAKNVTFGLTVQPTKRNLMKVPIQVEVRHALYPKRIIKINSTYLYSVGDSDDCLSSPCMHTSTCNDGFGFYNCSCSAGFKGINCQTGINSVKHELETLPIKICVPVGVAVFAILIIFFRICRYKVSKSYYWDDSIDSIERMKCSTSCISDKICLYDRTAKYMFDLLKNSVNGDDLYICRTLWNNRKLKKPLVQAVVKFLPFYQRVAFLINWIFSLTKQQKEIYLHSKIKTAAHEKAMDTCSQQTMMVHIKEIWNRLNPGYKWNFIVQNWEMLPSHQQNKLSNALCALPHREKHIFPVNIGALQTIDLNDFLDEDVQQNAASDKERATNKTISTLLRRTHFPGFTVSDSDDGHSYAVITSEIDECFNQFSIVLQTNILSSILFATEALAQFIEQEGDIFKLWLECYNSLHLNDGVIDFLKGQKWKEFSSLLTDEFLGEHIFQIFETVFEKYAIYLDQCCFNKSMEIYENNGFRWRHMNSINNETSEIASEISYDFRTFTIILYDERVRKGEPSKYVKVTVKAAYCYGISFCLGRKAKILAVFQQLLEQFFTNVWIRSYLKQLPSHDEVQREENVEKSFKDLCEKIELLKGRKVTVVLFEKV